MDWYTLKKHFFSSEEIKNFIVVAVFLGFMFSFGEWGTEKLDALIRIFNWFNSIIVVGFALFIYLLAQRITAIRKGYSVEYKIWFYGLIIALLITFITRGRVILAFVGTTLIYHLEGHRLGKFRYGLNYKDLGVISLMGPLSTLFIAFIFKFLSTILTNSPLVSKMVVVALSITCINMLPLPWIDGGNVFFASRVLWIFSFISFIVASTLLYFMKNVIGIIFVALLIGIIAAILWFVFFEEGF
ncbi:MAG: hypothetical protein QXG86_01795 [Candidatus Woesearchaeota archaeon]